MKVIIINGAGGCGKDTFIKLFTKYAGEKCVFNISTVDYIKKVAKILDWKEQKDDKSRKFLCELKEMAIYWGDIPYKDMMRQTQYFWSHLSNYDMVDKGFVFIHSREPEEIQRFVDNMEYPTITLLIRRAAAEQPPHDRRVHPCGPDSRRRVPVSGGPEGLSLAELQRLRHRRARSLRPAQRPRAHGEAVAGGRPEPRLLLLFPRRPARL